MGAKSYQHYRQSVTMDKEISKLRAVFKQQKDTRRSNSQDSLADTGRSGYAMFALKHRSLLSFETQTGAERANLETVIGLPKLPSDTQLWAVFRSY